MRIVLLANNWVGLQVASWLHDRGDTIAGLVVHPPERGKYREEILESCGLPSTCVFDGSQLRRRHVVDAIRQLQADIGLSVFFGYILRPEMIDLFPGGIVNLHPAYLPYNRGAYPNVWSIVDGTPAGATLHYVDAGVDTGDIIAQTQVPVEPVDTGETLYHKLERACLELFRRAWPLVAAGQADRLPQSAEAGTCHRVSDVQSVDEIELDRTFTARQLIDILRARTFPPYRGAYFRAGERRVCLHLQLSYEDEAQGR